MKGNVVPKKRLRTYVSKLQAMASVLFTLRPFLKHIWSAFYDRNSYAPLNCAWTSQVLTALEWMSAFIAMQREGPLLLRFTLEAHLNLGMDIYNMTDASPWGLGGVL